MKAKGFTLIETLIVMSIVMIISSVIMFQFKPQTSLFEHKLFLSQLHSDIYFAQQYAISHQQEVTFVIDKIQKRYYFRTKADAPLIINRYYPPSVIWQAATLPLTFKFLLDGNVNQFGSFYIYFSNKVYKLTFLLGKGRFYIEET